MESLTQICRSHFLAAFVPENKTPSAPSEAQNSGEAENKVNAVNVDVNDVSRGSRSRFHRFDGEVSDGLENCGFPIAACYAC